MKVWKYRMVVYLMKILYLKYSFFSRLTKFQQFMFRRIHWILPSPDGPRKILYIICLYVEIHCALIEYKNEKFKPVNYLIQLVDLDNYRDQQKEWLSERYELVTDLDNHNIQRLATKTLQKVLTCSNFL